MFDIFRKTPHVENGRDVVQEREIERSAAKRPDKRVLVSEAFAIDKAESERKMADIKDRLSDDGDVPALERELDLIKEDNELARLVEEIFENGNHEVLREKSALQVDEMRQLYFDGVTLLRPGEFLRKRKKLKLFQKFVRGLTPVRADKNDFDEFLSPDQTGEVSSYGVMDTLIHAEEFVYGSFGEIPHFIAGGKSQKELIKNGIEGRSQIVMNDVNNVRARAERGESFMKKYVTNLFDYQNGQEILALYFAIVFESPDQVTDMLGRGVGPDVAQRWDDWPQLHYRSRDFVADSNEAYQEQEEREKELTRLFDERMKDVLAKTGIEPPLSLELRIRGGVRVVKKEG